MKKSNSKITKLSTALLIGSAVIGATNCEAQVEKDSLDLSKDSKKENQLEPKIFVVKKDSVELERRLKELAKTEYTDNLRFGAMCYESGEIIDSDYTCPTCGKLSIVKNSDKWGISQIRDIVKEIKSIGYDVILDEKEFCEFCNGKEKSNPVLKFMIRFSENSEYHKASSNILSDYDCLLQFFRGKEKYISEGRQEKTINDNINVVYKMTGLGKGIINYNNQTLIKRDSVELENRLKILAEVPYTGSNRYIGATCYTGSYESYDYYICPTCGKETRRKDSQLRIIKQVEKIVTQIKEAGYDVVLEKKEYCKYCSHRVFINEPSLVFKIRFSENSNYHIVKSSILSDYDCLLQFLFYRKTFIEDRKMNVIHDNIDVIQKMTGLGSEIIISNPKPKKK